MAGIAAVNPRIDIGNVCVITHLIVIIIDQQPT